MALNLDTRLIDPATLTGYVRAAMANALRQKPTLASFLPVRIVDSIHVDFETTQAGLVPAANFRMYSAAPDPTTGEDVELASIRLPALGTWVPITEADALTLTRGKPTPEAMQAMVRRAAKRAVDAVMDRLEATAGLEIATGKAIVKTGGFSLSEDFGRDKALTITATKKWTADGADPLADISTWSETYAAANGGLRPGALIVSPREALALASSGPFKTVLAGGASRPATREQVNEVLLGSDLPGLFVYGRTVVEGKAAPRPVLPADSVFLVPAPVDPLEGESALGSTFMGPTLSAMEDAWRIPEEDRSGIVAGYHTEDVAPHTKTVYADATGLPVLANANLSMAVNAVV